METLTLKDLKCYLDTGLKCHVMGLWVDDGCDEHIPVNVEIVGLNTGFVEIHEIGRTITEQYKYADVFPHFLPLSALTEPLEDGSIPIMQLHKIAHKFETGQIIKYWYVDYSENKMIGSKGFVTLEYYDTSKCIYSFSYDEELCRFITRDETNARPKATAYQLQLFEYLYANHFWLGDQSYFEKGLIIDKRTIKL